MAIKRGKSKMSKKKALVCGASGFVGGHMVKFLKERGYFVRAVDIKEYPYGDLTSDEFILGDLRHPKFCDSVFDQPYDEVYQLAADMGGAGYIFTGEHNAQIMHNSALINLNIAQSCVGSKAKKIFFSSSACVYQKHNQESGTAPICSEDSAYPADPDSEYGWEKLFSERLYLSYAHNMHLNVRIARFHNIFGPEGSWNDGREKAPAAICTKVAMAKNGGEIEIWGDGKQTRTFLFIDECLEGIRRLMDSNVRQPINIGSEEMISIDNLAKMVMGIAGKKLKIKHIPGPVGVRGRSSDNRLIYELLKWKPSTRLSEGMVKTYYWIESQIKKC
jgi:nucleoside-diphosphate-sugar epimerase